MVALENCVWRKPTEAARGLAQPSFAKASEGNLRSASRSEGWT